MDYTDIRDRFIKLSGRYDLVDTSEGTISDMIDFFLNAGQRYLDHRIDSGKMEARYPINLNIGEFIAKTPGIRAIKEVWVATEYARWQLHPMGLNELRSIYRRSFSSTDYGNPLCYAVAKFRPIPDNLADTSSMNDVEDLIIDNLHYTYKGVLISPPPNQAITLTIWGLFYSPELKLSSVSKSYWTEVHPELLIQAAMMKVSSFYGDPTRVKEHKESILEEAITLDYDLVDQMLVGKMEMGD